MGGDDSQELLPRRGTLLLSGRAINLRLIVGSTLSFGLDAGLRWFSAHDKLRGYPIPPPCRLVAVQVNTAQPSIDAV